MTDRDREAVVRLLHERCSPPWLNHWEDLEDYERRQSEWWAIADSIFGLLEPVKGVVRSFEDGVRWVPVTEAEWGAIPAGIRVRRSWTMGDGTAADECLERMVSDAPMPAGSVVLNPEEASMAAFAARIMLTEHSFLASGYREQMRAFAERLEAQVADGDVWHHAHSYERWSPDCGQDHRKGVDFQTFDPLAVTCPACSAKPWVAAQQAKASR